MASEKKKCGGLALFILFLLLNFSVLMFWCFVVYSWIESGKELDPAMHSGGLNPLGYTLLIALPFVFFFISRFIYIKFFKCRNRTEEEILRSKLVDARTKSNERASMVNDGYSSKAVHDRTGPEGTEIEVKDRVSIIEAELATLKALILEDPESKLKVAHLKKEMDLLKWLIGILIALAGIVIPFIILLVRK